MSNLPYDATGADANQSFGIAVNAGNGSSGGPVNAERPMGAQAGLTQQQQLQLQQRQRMLLQQRALQQQKHQQALQNYESQFYQLLMTLNKKPKRIYNFVEDADQTLKKYEQYRPSFEFHIYENNYKICAPANTRLQQQQKTPELNSDGLILNKNNAILKDFLEYVARGKIPESITEVLRDCNIQFYEGNLILQVYDHTNTVDVVANDQNGQQSSQQKNSSTPEQQGDTAVKRETDPQSSSETPEAKKTRPATYKRPRVYRTLLEPSDLTHYYDMMSYADHTRFSDSIYQQLESEILSLTKRNLSLDVPLNPYDHRDIFEPEAFATPSWDENTKRFKHIHREECKKPGTKGAVGHIDEHEELPQHSSNYEQMMLIMSERTTTSTNATFAASLTKNALQLEAASSKLSNGRGSPISGGGKSGNRGSTASRNQAAIAAAAAAAAAGLTAGNENNQFSRLKFIEQWRLNREKRKQQTLNNNIAPNSLNNAISMAAPLTAQQQLLQQQQSMERADQRQDFQSEQRVGSQQAAAKKRMTNDKPKPKRPRKTKKAAADGAEPQAKKKRVTKKKQADNSSPVDTSEAF
ncbi:hypothetical protein HG536_0E00220 [Torulaspora globosa]|uniref:Spt20-like SEP domain-containing protein n=1 Tax=Torulaspora globosa TaxID=48254 RepID=A0A7G3ZHX6_9SACH|nr:uncharacterized protein HG536_0E00220 [Torulaspora globosa]QLL33112.1 hypothetical protein HG536_0E00220 [Torulaspora globosa]